VGAPPEHGGGVRRVARGFAHETNIIGNKRHGHLQQFRQSVFKSPPAEQRTTQTLFPAPKPDEVATAFPVLV